MRRSIIYILYTQPPVTPENGKDQAKQPLSLLLLALATQVHDFGAVAAMGEYSNFVHS